MREFPVSKLQESVEQLFLASAYNIGADVQSAVEQAVCLEASPAAQAVLEQIAQNYQIARSEQVAICQDTGMAVLFIELGQDVHFTGGDFSAAINEGVKSAYQKGYLRKSVVREPIFERKNSGDNTPAVIHLSLVPGDQIHILVTAKGFGSENMSAIRMLTPADGEDGVLAAIVDTVRKAGPNPCPPVIVGVGVGGTFEQAALMAKKCTARPVGSHNADSRYAALESKALDAINRLGIGAAGIGGSVTALAVNIAYAPTHIAGLPVAVNICCHAARHAEITL